MTIKKGDSVRQLVTPIEGVADSFSVDQESGQILVLVKWTDAEGTEHSKYFSGDELEVLS